MGIVKFKKNITQTEYDALAVKSPTTLYLVSDAKIICLGSEIYGSQVEISNDAGNLITLKEDGLYARLGEVTGVKGAAEDEYRSGNVELAPEDLGAENSANRTGALDDQASEIQYPSAKAVYNALAVLKQGKVDKNGTDRLMTVDEATKLAGIAAGAQVNYAFATAAEANAGTVTNKVMSPYLTAQAIANAGKLGVISKKSITFSAGFSAHQESYSLVDGRGIATIVCAAKKTSNITATDTLAVLPAPVIPANEIYFPVAMYNNQGDVPKLGMSYINAKGEIKFMVAGPATVVFIVTYSIA
jgi:hypothetical protein